MKRFDSRCQKQQAICEKIHNCYFAGQCYACSLPQGANSRDCILNANRIERVDAVINGLKSERSR